MDTMVLYMKRYSRENRYSGFHSFKCNNEVIKGILCSQRAEGIAECASHLLA